MKNKFLYKLKTFLYLYKNRFLSVLAVLIFLAFVLEVAINQDSKIVIEASTDIIDNAENIQGEIQSKENLDKFLKCISNIDNIKNCKIDGQMKYLNYSKTQDNVFDYKDLMSLSISTTMSNQNEEINLMGFANLDISAIDISLKFPMLINDLASDNYEIFLDIPSSYKESFNMEQDIDYLYINKDSIDYINTNYGNLKDITLDSDDFSQTNYLAKTNIDSNENKLLNITYKENDEANGIFDFEFDIEDLLFIKNISAESFKDSYFINTIFSLIFMNIDETDSFEKLKGQMAINNDVVTDLYIEIYKDESNIIAFRILFTEINNENVIVDKFESYKIKDFSTFIDEINSNKQNIEVQSNDKIISIGDVYFTGEDETTKVEEFSKKEIPSIINVFINFTDCSKQTILVIKWFYENQEIPIAESKISNGDYEKGMLKTSIAFTDTNSVQEGKYTLKIFIEGQEDCIFENYFEIK